MRRKKEEPTRRKMNGILCAAIAAIHAQLSIAQAERALFPPALNLNLSNNEITLAGSV
jgi:hypothetical protein